MLYKYFNKTGESGSVYIGYNHNMMVTPTLCGIARAAKTGYHFANLS